MEDKRTEELKEKAEKVSTCLEEITLQSEDFEKIFDAVEFLDTHSFYSISIKADDTDFEFEEFELPLWKSDKREVIDMIREKLEGRLKERRDKILELYEELDGLLK